MLDKWNDSFAKSQLEKYGWKSGEGLGKNKHGNAKHITVTVKNDTKGVGSNNEQWDFAWWDHLYNKSANAVSVATDTQNGEVKIEIKKKSKERRTQTGIISTHRPMGKKETTSMAAVAEEQNLSDSVREVQTDMAQMIARTSLYSGFVKSSTQSPAFTPQAQSDDEDEEKDYSIKITDEELFAACEGRTARKGGRGLVEQKGKYARVMKEYLQYANDEKENSDVKPSVADESKESSKRKEKRSKKEKKEKKEKKRKHSDDDEDGTKKKRKKDKEEKKKKKKKDKKD